VETSVHLILCVQHRSGDRSVRLDCGNAQARPQGQSGGMSSVDQQFAAVFGALVPFLLAVSVVAAGIWTAIAWAYGWRYGGTIEHLEAQLRLVAEERRIASNRENALASTVDSLKTTVESLTAELAKSKAKIEDGVARQLESDVVGKRTDGRSSHASAERTHFRLSCY